MAVLKSQGTELFLLDVDNGQVLKIACITSLEGLGGQASEIDITCFDDTESRRFIAGLFDPGTVTFGLNMDTDNLGYMRLEELRGSANMKWVIGMSDGFGIDPTYDAGPPPDFTLPTGRTWITLEGSVNQLGLSASADDIWRVQASIRVSGPYQVIPA